MYFDLATNPSPYITYAAQARHTSELNGLDDVVKSLHIRMRNGRLTGRSSPGPNVFLQARGGIRIRKHLQKCMHLFPTPSWTTGGGIHIREVRELLHSKDGDEKGRSHETAEAQTGLGCGAGNDRGCWCACYVGRWNDHRGDCCLRSGNSLRGDGCTRCDRG